MQELSQFTQFTGVGVSGLAVFLMYKLTANHLAHLTKTIERLTEVIVRLEDWLKEHHKN